MGVDSDAELNTLVAVKEELINTLALSLEEPSRLGIHTQLQALRYIGAKIRGHTFSVGWIRWWW
jgi:DNA-directed RNA polymerase III subunit RPC2